MVIGVTCVSRKFLRHSLVEGEDELWRSPKGNMNFSYEKKSRMFSSILDRVVQINVKVRWDGKEEEWVTRGRGYRKKDLEILRFSWLNLGNLIEGPQFFQEETLETCYLRRIVSTETRLKWIFSPEGIRVFDYIGGWISMKDNITTE